jgi:hypothetical protein
VTFKYLGQPISFSRKDWAIILAVLWGFVVVCLLALILNHYLKKSCEIRVCKGKVVLLGWRQIEGFIALGVAGKKNGWLACTNVIVVMILTNKKTHHSSALPSRLTSLDRDVFLVGV